MRHPTAILPIITKKTRLTPRADANAIMTSAHGKKIACTLLCQATEEKTL